MKKTLSKLLPILMAGLMLTAIVFAFTGCGPVDYVFEAEYATLGDTTEVQGESGNIYNSETSDMTGEDLKWVSNFGSFWNSAEEELIWTITSDKACEATFVLNAASAAMGMNADGATGTSEIDLSDEDCGVTFTNNDTAITFDADACVLTGITYDEAIPWADVFAGTNDKFTMSFRVFNQIKGTINLVKGENKIVLTATSKSVNVDKLTITADAKLTWTPADNGLFEEEEAEAE